MSLHWLKFLHPLARRPRSLGPQVSAGAVLRILKEAHGEPLQTRRYCASPRTRGEKWLHKSARAVDLLCYSLVKSHPVVKVGLERAMAGQIRQVRRRNERGAGVQRSRRIGPAPKKELLRDVAGIVFGGQGAR